MRAKKKPVREGDLQRAELSGENSRTRAIISDRRKLSRGKFMDEQNKEKPSYWAVIPAKVRYDPELPPGAKLLYAEISALTDQSGYCFAANAYFEVLYGLSKRTIQDYLTALKRRGYIRIADGCGGKQVRKIYAGINPLFMNPAENCGDAQPADVPHAEICTGGCENLHGAVQNSAPPTTNKKINNKTNSNPPQAPQGAERAPRYAVKWKPERFEKFWNFYPRLPDGRKPNKARAAKAWDKIQPDDSTIKAMATALLRQMNSEQWTRGIGIPYASTWLNSRAWEEDYQPPEQTEGGYIYDEEGLPEWT